jgi:arginase
MDSTRVKTENKELFSRVAHPYAKRIPHIWTMWQRVSSSIKTSLEDGKFPIVLTGDHSTAGGLISGMKMAYPEKRVGVIWIDAHADIHSPYTTPSGNVHGMPIAALLNDDNRDCERNVNLDSETVSIWTNMKKLGGIAPKVNAENIVYIAVRDTEQEEDHIIEKKQIKKISVDTLRRRGIQSIVSEVLEYLKVDVIYISFDVDSMDPSLSQGTGTPVPLGITNVEAESLIKGLAQDSRVKAFEMTEVNPTLDTENKMAKNALNIFISVTYSIYSILKEEIKK